MHSKLKGLIWLGLGIAGGGALALGTPYFAKHVSWKTERRLAASWEVFPESSVCFAPEGTPPRLALSKLVARIFPLDPEDRKIPLSVQVVRGKSVNAFATLGARIFIYDGLIQNASSSDEVAGVLAHEIEHVKQRHVMQGIFTRFMTVGVFYYIFKGGRIGSRTIELLLHMHFSRSQESEADRGGFKRLQEARVDPAGLGRFFERLSQSGSIPEILSDHPSNESRAELAKHYPLSGQATPVLTPDEWAALRKICK